MLKLNEATHEEKVEATAPGLSFQGESSTGTRAEITLIGPGGSALIVVTLKEQRVDLISLNVHTRFLQSPPLLGAAERRSRRDEDGTMGHLSPLEPHLDLDYNWIWTKI